MIDSGAEYSILKSNLLVKNHVIFKDPCCFITGVTPGEIKSIGTSELSLNFGDDMVLEHDFQIVPPEFPIFVDGILGKDFFENHKCIINYDTYIFTIHTKKFNVDIPFMVSLENGKFILPKRSQVIRQVNLDIKKKFSNSL